MPTIAIEINDVDAAIIRPIAAGIIEDVKRITGIDEKCKTIFLGALGRAAQPGSTIDSDPKDLSASDMLVQFDLEEDPLDETVLTNGVYNRNHHYVFSDPILGINIKPVYTQTEFTLNIKGRFPDKNSAVKWRNEFRRFTMSGRRTNTHTVTYHYPLPSESIIILAELHRLRERRAPYNETFETYVRNHIGDNITTLADQAGNNQTVAITESQVNVVGWFDAAAQPEPAAVDKEKSAYEVTFIYKYRIDKPISVVMQYPLMVHNQILSNRFRSDEVPYSVEKEALKSTIIQNAQDIMRSNYPGIKKGYAGITYPFYDDWLPNYRSPFHTDMVRFMLRVSQTALRDVLDLNELDVFELDPLLKAYLSTRPIGPVTEFEAAVHLRLYDGQTMVEEPCMTMTSGLIVTSTADLVLRKQYHLILAVLPDLTMLTSAALEHLRAHGAFLLALAAILYPGLDLSGIILRSDGTMKLVDFNKLINEGKNYYNSHSFSPDYFTSTVAAYTIVAHRSA